MPCCSWPQIFIQLQRDNIQLQRDNLAATKALAVLVQQDIVVKERLIVVQGCANELLQKLVG